MPSEATQTAAAPAVMHRAAIGTAATAVMLPTMAAVMAAARPPTVTAGWARPIRGTANRPCRRTSPRGMPAGTAHTRRRRRSRRAESSRRPRWHSIGMPSSWRTTQHRQRASHTAAAGMAGVAAVAGTWRRSRSRQTSMSTRCTNRRSRWEAAATKGWAPAATKPAPVG